MRRYMSPSSSTTSGRSCPPVGGDHTVTLCVVPNAGDEWSIVLSVPAGASCGANHGAMGAPRSDRTDSNCSMATELSNSAASGAMRCGLFGSAKARCWASSVNRCRDSSSVAGSRRNGSSMTNRYEVSVSPGAATSRANTSLPPTRLSALDRPWRMSPHCTETASTSPIHTNVSSTAPFLAGTRRGPPAATRAVRSASTAYGAPLATSSSRGCTPTILSDRSAIRTMPRPVDLVPGRGLEPLYAAPKTAVLPLNDPGKTLCEASREHGFRTRVS